VAEERSGGGGVRRRREQAVKTDSAHSRARTPAAAMAVATTPMETGHQDVVHDCQLDYYGTRLATCSSDRTVKVFSVSGSPDAPSQSHLADLSGHEGPVWQVAWAHPKFGSLLATCGYDHKVIVWREAEGSQGRSWTQVYVSPATLHDSSVNSVCWAPHELGLMLASASSDGSVAVLAYNDQTGEWDSKKLSGAHTLGALAVSWSPAASAGALVGVAQGAAPVRRLVSAGCDNTLKVWVQQAVGGEWALEHTLSAHSDWVRDAAWAPNIGLPKNTIASASQDGTVQIWTQADAGAAWTNVQLHNFGAPVWRVSWSVTGNILAVSDANNQVTLWKEAIDGQWTQVQSVQ